MREAFYLGGWGMYPTLLFGVLFISAAVWYARRPARERLPLLAILSLLTMAAGSLGFASGMMATLSHATDVPNQATIIAQGTFESLNNLTLALCLIVIGGLVSAVGAFRAATPPGAAAPDLRRAAAPHG